MLVFEPFLLGDFLMGVPAFRFLRERFPNARIDCIVPPVLAGLDEFFPWLDTLIPFQCPWSPQYRDWSPKNLRAAWRLLYLLRRNRYDWAFDLRGDVRDIYFLFATGASRRAAFDVTGGTRLLTDVVPYDGQPYQHIIEGNLLSVMHPLGAQIEPSAVNCRIHIPSGWRAAAEEWLRERCIQEFVAVHPCASLAHKRWPAASWAELLQEFVLPHHPVVLFSTAHETPILEEITRGLERFKGRVHVAQDPLPMFFSLTSLSRGVISLDSAAAHLGVAAGVPVVALLGPRPASLSKPYGVSARAVYIEDVPCRPCDRRCTQPRNFCMQDLDVTSVVTGLRDLGIV